MKVTKLNESKEPLYVIKDSKGNQLSAPNPDDNELWDRVSDFESRGRRGLCVVAYTGKGKDECMEEDMKSNLSESHDDTVEFVMQIEDMIREVTPKIIDKAFGKSYSFDLDGEGSEEDAMDSFREAVHELAMAIYSMVVARREGYDESLNEGLHITGMTISDLIAAMQDNVDDSKMDSELKFLDSVNNRLGTDDAFFVIDDGGYLNPDYIDVDAGIEEDDNLYTIGRDGIKVYREDRPGGTIFLYFKNENDYRRYARFVDDYYDDDIDEGILDTVKEIAPKVIDTIGKTPEAILSTIDKMHS